MHSQNGTEPSSANLAQSLGGLYFLVAMVLLFAVAVLTFGGAAFLSRQGGLRDGTPAPAPVAVLTPEPADTAEKEAMYAKLAALSEELSTEAAERNRLAKRLDELMNLRSELALDKAADDNKGGGPGPADASPAALLRSVEAVERELATVAQLLEATEQKISGKQIQVAGLGARLNRALLARVEELQRGRSEFFDGLRTVLSDQPGFKIEGDRFTLPSEVLFAPGSDRLHPEGSDEVRRLAATINQVRSKFPPGIHWVLRVSGHTDPRPIANARFPSNWELSAMRAVTVVKQLIAAGVPPEHVAATGFGEFQPATLETDPASLARNRRIEFRLDH